MPTALDETAAELLRRRIKEHGVEVRLDTTTEAVQRSSDGSLEILANGKPPIDVDIVIVGAGVRPNVGFLAETPVEIDRGILVDERMETNIPGIYAAGDVARGPTAFGKPHETHALWPTAVEHGRVAGTNLTGRTLRYRGSLSMNVTEMFGMTVASMGQFIEPENLNGLNGGEISSYVEGGSSAERYLKILFKDQIPVGAVVLGTAEDAVLLGRLRPWIRWKRRILDFSGFIEGRYILPQTGSLNGE
jgi:nitrite reductase (NADH) large subunit